MKRIDWDSIMSLIYKFHQTSTPHLLRDAATLALHRTSLGVPARPVEYYVRKHQESSACGFKKVFLCKSKPEEMVYFFGQN